MTRSNSIQLGIITEQTAANTQPVVAQNPAPKIDNKDIPLDVMIRLLL